MEKEKTLSKVQKDLPENWIVRFSTKYKGRVFYFNTLTGKSSWALPTTTDLSVQAKPKGKPKMPAQPSSTTIKLGQRKTAKRPSEQVKTTKITQNLVKSNLQSKKDQRTIAQNARRLSFPVTTVSAKQNSNKRKGTNLSSSLPLIPTKKASFSIKAMQLPKKNSSTLNKSFSEGFTNPLLSNKIIPKKNKLSKAEAIQRYSKKNNIKQSSDIKQSSCASTSSTNMHKDVLTETKYVSPLNKIATSSSAANTDKDIEMDDISLDNNDTLEVDSSHSPPSSANAIIFVVIDTNVFLNNNGLEDINQIIDWYPLPLGHFRRAIVVVPWVVLQELDALKMNNNTKQKARQSVAWLNRHFSAKKLGIRGQTIMEAATFIEGFSPENNDDRILQCCWFFQHLQGRHVTLLYTHDTNLCNKALVSNFRTYSTIKTLKSGITQMCKQRNLKFDDDSSLPTVATLTTPKDPPEVKASDSNVKCKGESPEIASDLNTEDLLTDTLSFALQSEMEKAYGPDMWKEVVLIKPPWSLIDVLRCMKKHWIAVFSMIGVDRLASVHIDQLIKMFTGLPREKNATGPHDDAFVTSSIELLTALSSRVSPNIKLRHAIKNLQACQKNLKNSKEKGGAECHRTSIDTGEAEVTSTTNITEPAPSMKTSNVSNVDDHVADKSVFWCVLDQVWSSIVTHSVAILRSLPFVTSRALNQSPTELKEQMQSPSNEQEIPSREMSLRVLPLLLQLMKGLHLSLERILLACNKEGTTPLVADCFDFLQSLWTTSQAFSLHTKVESLCPELVQMCTQNNSDKSQLQTGLAKLSSVYDVLEDCREMALRAL